MILRLVENGPQVRAELLDANQQPLAVGTFAEVATPAITLSDMEKAVGEGSSLDVVAQQLGAVLLPESVWDVLRVAPQPSLLRLEIPKSLANLPWEIAVPPDTSTGLFQNTDFLIYRWAKAVSRNVPKPASWPIRVLIVVGTAPDDDLQAIPERDSLLQNFLDYGHSFDVEVMLRPSHTALVDEISKGLQPHIVHFIGHSATAGNISYLDIRGDDAWPWYTSAFGPDLKAWTPNFVFLNACRTANAELRRASIGVARAFLNDGGVQGVLSMQADITGPEAVAFSSEFYRNIAAGKDLAAAVAEGRNALGKITDTSICRWALPVLTLVAPPEEIIPIRRYTPSPQLNDFAEAFPETRLFALRHEERREFLANLQPVIFVTGDSDIGKSHLVRWCLEGCALRGHGVHYVNRKEGGQLQLVDLLRMILRKSEGHRPHGLPEDCFHRFHFELRHLLTQGIRGEWNGQAEEFCEIPADASKFKNDQTHEHVIDSFLGCIKTCMERRPGSKFFLVVDQLEVSLEPLQWQRDGFLLNTLNNAIRSKNIPGFHLVLVLGQTNVPAIKEAAEKKLVTHVSLGGLPKKKGAEFLTEALRYRTGRFGGMMHLFAEDITEDPFKPLALDASLRYLERSLGTPERMR